MICGSYHNFCLSQRLPKAIDDEKEEAAAKIQKSATKEDPKQQIGHKDDDCPHIPTLSKLKGEIKRLRQDLIMKGPAKKTNK